jgi:hypothetical protein
MNSDWDTLAHGLVGSPPRLLIAAYLATLSDDEWFRQEDVRVATELRQAEVNRIMPIFEKLNLVKCRRQPPHDWPHYQRVPSEIWAVMARLKDAIAIQVSQGQSAEETAGAAP